MIQGLVLIVAVTNSPFSLSLSLSDLSLSLFHADYTRATRAMKGNIYWRKLFSDRAAWIIFILPDILISNHIVTIYLT